MHEEPRLVGDIVLMSVREASHRAVCSRQADAEGVFSNRPLKPEKGKVYWPGAEPEEEVKEEAGSRKGGCDMQAEG